MSSRSSSPLPPLDPKPLEHTSSSLSNDALYAPLSNYDETKSSTHQKNRHSLTLQTSSSLRESSLITFLTSTCQNLKTSHPYEFSLYRGIGGSISKHGMGDNDNANSITKSSIESKLSNRSLVLVGGGIHSHAPRTPDECRVDSSITAIASASTKKRDRKRVGGNGMFGSLSRRKRNKILRGKLALPCRQDSSYAKLNRECSDHEVAIAHDEDHISLQNICDSSSTARTHQEEDFSAIVENLNSMWINYMSQLMLQIKPQAPISGKPMNFKYDKASMHDPHLTPQLRRQLTSLLIDAEHAGMSVTIVQCLSQRHLAQRRGVVVNETVNTWRVAMAKMGKRCNQNRNLPTDSPSAGDPVERLGPKSPSRHWKIVMIPKHGTVFDVNMPWFEDSSCKLTFQSKMTLTIRLET